MTIAPASGQQRISGLDVLARFEALQSDDTVKRDLELTCRDCNTVICDIEHEDTLEILAGAALDHECAPNPDKCDECGLRRTAHDTSHRYYVGHEYKESEPVA